MTFGEKITLLRKQHKWSQDELAKKISTSAPIVGRYERNEIKPSIEVASKIANALDVSLDYLVGNTDLEFDTHALKRMEIISKLPEESKKQVYILLDALLRDFQARSVYGVSPK